MTEGRSPAPVKRLALNSSVSAVVRAATRTKAPNASTCPAQRSTAELTVASAVSATGLTGDTTFGVSGIAVPSVAMLVLSRSARIVPAIPSSFPAASSTLVTLMEKSSSPVSYRADTCECRPPQHPVMPQESLPACGFPSIRIALRPIDLKPCHI